MARTTAARPDAGAPGTWPGFAVMLAMTATVLMLEATRVFVAYLVFVVDQSRRVELATIALGVFVAIGFGGLLRRAAGWRLMLSVTVLGLATARLVLQFWELPEARIVLGAVVIVSWGWLMTVLLQSLRDAAALGVLLGLALDLAIRIGFETVDLPWMPDALAHVVTVILVIVLTASALMVIGLDEPPIASAPGRSLIALGPGLAVFHLLTGNLGAAQAMLDVDFPAAAGILAIGTVLGLLISALATVTPSIAGMGKWLRSPRVEGPLAVFILAGVGLVSLLFAWQSPGMSGVALVFGVAGTIVLLALALVSSEPGQRPIGGSVGFWLTAGLVIQAILLFAYYTFTGPPLLIVVAWLLLLAGAFANGARAVIDPAWERSSLRYWFGAAAIVLLAIAAQQELVWSRPKTRGPLLGNDLTVMTYNIQSGFSRDHVFDLERTAQTIELNDPDIVVLQEVSRGWLVTSGVDEVLWLSQRLGMPFYFGAASDDGLWGNAILTKAPVSDEEARKFRSSANLRRSVLGVTVETKDGPPLRVLATHLDNPGGAGQVRLEQVEQLLAFWNQQIPAIIAGDFNATPDSDVVQRLRRAGFNDRGDLIGDATTSEDNRRIDYIFTTAGLTVTDVRIDPVWTSDHLPVTMWMTMME